MRTKASLIRRLTAAIRSYRIPPVSIKDPLIAEKLGWNTASASSGIAVSEETALNYAAVWAAVSLISATVASLPLKLYKRLPNGGKEPFVGHRTYQLLHDEPNPEMTSMVFRETLQAHVLTWGNAYAEIERNGGGAAVALWPLPPDRVYPIRHSQVLRYEVINREGRSVTIDAMNMLHVPGLGYNGTYGYSVIAMARESLGLGLAAERFGSTFFGNGTTFGGYLEHPETLGDDARQNLRESLEAKHQGPSRAHRIMLLEEGMKFKESSGIPPNDAQFLETRVFQIQEVARWFRIQPHKLGELTHATFSNIEHQAIEFVTDTIRPWLVRWEQEINRKLISPLERRQQFAEHLVDGLLRGDINSRYGAYAVGRQWGWLCADDVRERENMNPLPDEQGKIFLVPMNMTPAARINEIIDSQIKKNEPAPAPAPTPVQQDTDLADDRAAVSASLDRLVQLLEGEIPQLRRVATEAEARAEEAARVAASATTQVSDHQAAAEAARAQVEAAQRELGEKIALLALAQEERDRERMRAEGAEVARAALQTELAASRDEIDAAAQRAAAAQAQVDDAERARREAEAVLDARNADLEAARADVARAEQAIAVTREQLAQAEAKETAAIQAAEAAERRSVDAAERESVASCAHNEVAQRLAASEHALSARTADLDAAQTRVREAEDELARARERAQANDEASRATIVRAETALEIVRAELAERTDQHAVQVASVASLTRDLEAAKADHQSTIDDVVRIEAERDETRRLADDLTRARDEASARYATLEGELATALAARADADARAAALQAEAERLRAEADAALDQAAMAEHARAELVAERDAAREVQTSTAERLADLAARRSTASAAAISAHRELYVDVMRRMIDKEADRLTAAQASQDKLRAAAKSLYERHEQTVGDALVSAMRVHLATVGSTDDPAELARDLAQQHVESARTDVARLLEEDSEAFHVELARTLRLWRDERVHLIANHLIQREIDYVSRNQ